MSVDAFTLLFALLAVGAQLAVVVAVALAVGAHVSTRLAAARDRLVDDVGPQAVALALVVALVATLGSLYLSEVANFIPCRLCWYQRIAMYPLVPVLAVAAFRRDDHVWPYGLALAVIGAAISAYHVLLQRFPSLESGSCDPEAPCTLIWVDRFGYLTIPTMAGSGFLLVAVLMITARASTRQEDI